MQSAAQEIDTLGRVLAFLLPRSEKLLDLSKLLLPHLSSEHNDSAHGDSSGKD